ncbi:hypothetical protein ACFL22_01170 [Patescibacteria group bacterium]
MKIPKRIFDDFNHLVHDAVKQVISHIGDSEDGCRGGYFRAGVLTQSFDVVQVYLVQVQEVNNNMIQKVQDRSWEKMRRLSCTVGNGHVSSAQSRSPENGKFGGAIIVTGRKFLPSSPGTIFSFDGLQNEHADESVVIIVGQEMGWLSGDERRAIINISNNRIARQMGLLRIDR